MRGRAADWGNDKRTRIVVFSTEWLVEAVGREANIQNQNQNQNENRQWGIASYKSMRTHR